MKRLSTNSNSDLISRLRTAVEFESKHQYLNAIGKSGDFASFVKEEAKYALKIWDQSTKWNHILTLISRYPFLDQGARMRVCKTILELLSDLENLELSKRAPVLEVKPVDQVLKLASLDIEALEGIGPKIASKLHSLQVSSCEDLLNYLPSRHIAYSDVTPIRNLRLDEDVTIMGHITKISSFTNLRTGLIIISVFVKDNSGTIKINKFLRGNSADFYIKQYHSQFPQGSFVMCVGQVRLDKFSSQKTLANAMIEVISEDFSEDDRSTRAHLAKIVPVYPLTEGLSLMSLRRLIHQTLNTYRSSIQEFIPQDILDRYDLMPYAEALEEIHFPSSLEAKDKAARRLIFNDFFLMQVKFMQLRHSYKHKKQGIQFNCFENGLVDKFIDTLPFELTHAQRRVFFEEILPDMVNVMPMHRLLQGDVGSGKTIVAFLAALVAIADGYQVAMMVPTEILAEQHYAKFVQWVNSMDEALRIKSAILIGKQKVKERREILEALAKGSINLVVGTHALIQDQVKFQRLGLVIIDEQHRFGVQQRDMLATKAINANPGADLQMQLVHSEEGFDKLAPNPDLSVDKLFMTATPIPRTLALATYGDLDMSEIDQMPVGRKPVHTSIVSNKKEVYQLITDEISQGHQAYIVFPLIEESETLSAKAATVEYERLKESVFKDYRMGLIHGKLKDQEKESIMEEFRLGQIDILVSTTVIEVGVDVPNATVMLIESAERFGLAQLHQLRGRVGRSAIQSYCLLASSSMGENTKERLNILTKTNNGFLIAREDLRLRGSGDLAGLKQSGIAEASLEALVDQEELLKQAREAAQSLIASNPNCEGLDNLVLKLQNREYMMYVNAG